MTWTYFLTITNGTDRKLKLDNKELTWGTWYRNSQDDREPCSIEAGQTAQALGVRAARGTWTGYECSATWTDEVSQGQASYGSIYNYVNVPFSGSNNSQCKPNGAYKVSGWEDLSAHDTNFVRSIVVTVGPTGKLEATELDTAAPAEDAVDQEYREYLLAVNGNPDVREWSEIKDRLTEIDGFIISDYIPKKIDIAPKLVARSAPVDIKKSLWAGIDDPDCPSAYAQDLFVNRYFSVAVYSVATNPRSIISLARNETRKVSERIEVTSAIRNVLTTSMSVKQSLSGSGGIAELGAEIAASLDVEFSVENVLETSRQVVTERIEETTFTAPENSDLQIVPWVFSTAVLIYREDKKGKIRLLAASDWAQAQLFTSYTTSVS